MASGFIIFDYVVYVQTLPFHILPVNFMFWFVLLLCICVSRSDHVWSKGGKCKGLHQYQYYSGINLTYCQPTLLLTQHIWPWQPMPTQCLHASCVLPWNQRDWTTLKIKHTHFSLEHLTDPRIELLPLARFNKQASAEQYSPSHS